MHESFLFSFSKMIFMKVEGYINWFLEKMTTRIEPKFEIE